METTYSVDNQEPVTLFEIIENNEDLTPDEVEQIAALQQGESMFIEITEIKRIL